MLQISQRPLQGTAVDAALFVDRAPQLQKLRRSVDLGFNSLVLGDRGSGKTSLLHHFEWQLVQGGSKPIFAEASGATTARELVYLLYATIQGRRRDQTEKHPAPIGGDEAIGADVAQLRPANGERALVLLDSVARPELIHDLFGRLRDDVWQLPITWVVSGNRGDSSRYLEPPADAFFDALIELDEVDVNDATDLLQRRANSAPANDPDAEMLLWAAAPLARQVTPRTPRNLLAAAREVLLLANEDPTKWFTNNYALQRHAAELSRSAAMLFTELMDLAPVSASDKQLLERLGWTRTRAVQVFKQLEGAGLVVVTEDTPTGPGRPRRLYAPNPRYNSVELMQDRP